MGNLRVAPSTMKSPFALQWRSNERDGVTNNRRLDCLLNRWSGTD